MSTHAAKLATGGIRYLGDLQLSNLVQLHDELNALWNSGQSQVSNSLYDKVVDGINYETSQLTSDPFDFVVKRTNYELKNISVLCPPSLDIEMEDMPHVLFPFVRWFFLSCESVSWTFTE